MKTDFLTEKHQRKTLFLLLGALCFGGLLGTGLSILRCNAVQTPSFDLDTLLLHVSMRSVRQLVFTDVLFSLLVVLASFVWQGRAVQTALFLIKGFCISYLCTVFLFFWHAGGFLTAAVILLFHSFLILPLQLTTAITAGATTHRGTVKRKSISLFSLNAAAVLFCVFLEQLTVPQLLP